MAKILVVDDDRLIRYLLRQVLTLNKHKVFEAPDGLEALIAVELNTPDLILMDHQMPGLSGIDCTRQLKTLYPSLKIVLVSGSFGIDDDGYLAANKYLFTDMLLKPFLIKDLVSTIEYALGGKARESIKNFESGKTAQFG